MARHVDDRPQHLLRQLPRVADERPEQPQPGAAVVGPPVASRPAAVDRERALQHRRAPAVEGMGERRVGVDELDAVGVPVDRPEERRGGGQRQDRRAHVVAEPGERQLRGPGAATDRGGRLVDPDRAAGTGQGDRRGEAVGPRPDDDRVEVGRRHAAPDSSFGR